MSNDRTAGRKEEKGMLTPFGEKMRKIRKEKGLLLIDIAKIANVTSGFLSLVETGKKQVPDRVVQAIVSGLDLNAAAEADLIEAATLSAKEFKIQVEAGAPPLDRQLAHAMQVGFAKMSPKEKAQILRLLEKR